LHLFIGKATKFLMLRFCHFRNSPIGATYHINPAPTIFE